MKRSLLAPHLQAGVTPHVMGTIYISRGSGSEHKAAAPLIGSLPTAKRHCGRGPTGRERLWVIGAVNSDAAPSEPSGKPMIPFCPF